MKILITRVYSELSKRNIEEACGVVQMRRSSYKLDPGQLADLLSPRDYHVHRGLEEATRRNYDTHVSIYVSHLRGPHGLSTMSP